MTTSVVLLSLTQDSQENVKLTFLLDLHIKPLVMVVQAKTLVQHIGELELSFFVLSLCLNSHLSYSSHFFTSWCLETLLYVWDLFYVLVFVLSIAFCVQYETWLFSLEKLGQVRNVGLLWGVIWGRWQCAVVRKTQLKACLYSMNRAVFLGNSEDTCILL